MRNNLNRLATWIDVTDDAAPTTPDITFRTWVLLQWYSPPSMLLIEPNFVVFIPRGRFLFFADVVVVLYGFIWRRHWHRFEQQKIKWFTWNVYAKKEGRKKRKKKEKQRWIKFIFAIVRKLYLQLSQLRVWILNFRIMEKFFNRANEVNSEVRKFPQ